MTCWTKCKSPWDSPARARSLRANARRLALSRSLTGAQSGSERAGAPRKSPWGRYAARSRSAKGRRANTRRLALSRRLFGCAPAPLFAALARRSLSLRPRSEAPSEWLERRAGALQAAGKAGLLLRSSEAERRSRRPAQPAALRAQKVAEDGVSDRPAADPALRT